MFEATSCRENFEKEILHRLRYTWHGKNKGLIATTESLPCVKSWGGF